MERKIEIPAWEKLENVVNALLIAKAQGEHIYCDFNGHELHSDDISMDSAYMKVMGCTKAEYDHGMKKMREDFEKQLEIARQKAQENIPNCIARGRALIFPERYDEWEKCVNSIDTSLWSYLELNSALEIMEALENGVSIEEAATMFKAQENSAIFALFIRNVIFTFSNRGPEFWEATAYGELSPESKLLIEAKKQENIQLAQLNQLNSESTGRHN